MNAAAQDFGPVFHLASELSGGAGIAALRLHRALCELGSDSHLLCARGQFHAHAVTTFLPHTPILDKLADQLAWRRLRPGSSYFSRTRRWSRQVPPGLDRARIVHLHWTAKWLDLPSLFAAIPSTTPIVISLHDSAFFTGGCHQPDGCTRYLQSCGSCPKLRFSWPGDPSKLGFKVRQRLYAKRSLTIIPNSHWTASLAQHAPLFEHARILDPIHPGVDTRVFRPLDRLICRKILQLPQERFILAAGGADWGDTNKGFSILLKALALLPSPLRDKLLLLTYGSGQVPTSVADIPIHHLGFISSESLLALAYSAADLYCTPSLMETFGLTAAEAQACGLPVVAFTTGGLPEIITPGQTGWLVHPAGSVPALAGAITEAFNTDLSSFSTQARQSCLARFEALKTAAKYQTAYQTVCETAHR